MILKEETPCQMKKEMRRDGTVRLAYESETSKQTDAEREGRARSNTRSVQRLLGALREWQKTHPSPRHKT